MSWVDMIQAEDVKTPKEFVEFVRCEMGAVTTPSERTKFFSQWKQFKELNPHVEIGTMVRTVQWAKAKKHRLNSLCSIFPMVGWAHQEGALPELNPKNEKESTLEADILKALERETDPQWRRRLIMSEGPARYDALNDWRLKEKVSA